MMDVVFNTEKLGVLVNDAMWGDVPKVVITEVKDGQEGFLAGAKANWAVQAINGESLEVLGLNTHSELQSYIKSMPLRPLTMTLMRCALSVATYARTYERPSSLTFSP